MSELLCKMAGDDYYLVCNGRIVGREEERDDTKIYHICYRLPGGKGGFGSMLRTIGAQIEKTTNREAMRDLSGRRMRDINNEKKLADWVAGAAEREKEQEDRRRERLEKRRAEAEGRMHKFRDEKYLEQKDAVTNNLDDALTQGLKRSSVVKDSGGSLVKKSKKSAPSTSWAGLDLNDLSSSEDDEEESSKSEVKSELELIRESVPVSTELASNGETEKPPVTVASKDAEATEEISGNQKQTKVSEKSECKASEVTSNASSTEPIDLDSHQCATELEGYGLEHLKHELSRRGLKCGGSLAQRAERLYSVRGLSHGQIDPSLFAKKKK